MENNQNIKKWNKESLFSAISLVLVYPCIEVISGILNKIDYSGLTIFRFDGLISNISGEKWLNASMDLFYIIPIILGLILLLLSLFWGIKSIKKTSSGTEKGRILGIVSTTITTFILITMIIFNIFLY